MPETPSPGCETSTLTAGEHAGVEISFGETTRRYDLFVPPAHDGSTPLPLVLNFHGWTVSPADHAEFSQMNPTAAERGFLVAYPEGAGASWNAEICCGEAVSQGLDDVGFARAVVDAVGRSACVDLSRVYATGHSNGGFLSQNLACQATDVFAAVANIASTIGMQPADCAPSRPISILQIHGTADPIVAYEGGGFIGHPSAVATAAGWAARNQCDATPAVTTDDADTTCETWAGCAAGTDVTLCTVDGMGHCWPGNPSCPQGAASTTFHASEMMADFFASHALP